MVLAGDIGGTNTRLAVYESRGDGLRPLAEFTYKSREHNSLDEIALAFLSQFKFPVDRACFGVAGPVKEGRSKVSNLTWIVDAKNLARALKLDRVFLLNDLEAIAYGVSQVTDQDLVALNAGVPVPGNRAVVAAGTGLGEAGLFWDGEGYRPMASEGGHADFAPRNDLEIELLQFLMAKFGRVSFERILSGPGLLNLYEFFRDVKREPEPKGLADEMLNGDPGAVVTSAAMAGKSSLCERALDTFIEVYGAEAGNCALKFMALNGVFIAGGIAAKILPKFQQPEFTAAFIDKGRLSTLLEAIPVKVVTNEKVGLMGAAHFAITTPVGTPMLASSPVVSTK